MIASYKNKFIKVFFLSLLVLFLIVGVVIYMMNSIQNTDTLTTDTLANLNFLSNLLFPLAIISGALNILSVYLLAKAKGYSGWFGVLGLSYLLGLLVLFLLPNKNK